MLLTQKRVPQYCQYLYYLTLALVEMGTQVRLGLGLCGVLEYPNAFLEAADPNE